MLVPILAGLGALALVTRRNPRRRKARNRNPALPNYFMELKLAVERGIDDAHEGKPLDERMRNRVPRLPAWNSAMWKAYRDSYTEEMADKPRRSNPRKTRRNPWTTSDVETLRTLLSGCAPYVNVSRMDLGGADRASLYVTLSLDPKSSWPNTYLENSRYRKFALHHDHKLESISGGGKTAKFRAGKVKSLQHAAERLCQWAATPA